MNLTYTQHDYPLILVVDDDKFMRLQLRRAMEQAGYRVAEVNDGEQALDAYMSLQPDIVLLDALMPVMDGFTCCAKLQTLPRGDRIPILMITALDDQESVDRAFEAGAKDYITKPIHWAVLRQRVRRLLEASQAIEELRQQTERTQASEERLRLALDAAQMGTWDWDIKNDKFTYSSQTQSNFGLASNSFDGTYKDFLKSVHPEDRQLVKQALLRALEEGEDYNIEFRVVWPDDSVHWTASKGQIYYDETGKAVCMTGINMDITKRKQAEEALQVRVKQQAIVAELSQSALARKDLLSLMQEAVTHIAQSIEVEYCQVLELLPDAKVLLLRAGVGWEGLVGQLTIGTDLHSQAGYTLLSREPVIVTDLRTETRFNVPSLLLDYQIVSGVSVVIHGKDHPFGVLAAHTTKTRTFSRDDIYFLQTVANVIATAIERQRVEDALRESEQRWQLALRGNNDGIWDWNVKTNKAFYSTRWKEMLGYEDQEISNTVDEWATRVHPDDIGWVTQAIEDHFAKQTPFYITEHRLWCKDGTYKWILARGQALWDEDGNVVGMVGSHTDITERKQAEEELQRQNLRSQLFADITLKIRQSLQIEEILQTSVTEVQKFLQADRVLLFRLWTDGSGTVVQEAVVPGWPVVLGQNINDPCFQQQGYPEKYRKGRISAIYDIAQANTLSCHVQFLQQFGVKANLVVPILIKEELWGLLIAHQCAHPRQWTSSETELLRQLANQIGIALAQAQLLKQETRQRQELARSNAELQQFASIASHDLQEPLRKIKAFGDRLQDKCGAALTPQGSDYLQRMQNAAERMQNLIDDLLTLSRVTTRAQPFVPVNLVQITQEVLSDLEVRIQETNGVVEVAELATIEADPLQMRQLLQNLIGNALKFHRPEEPPVVKVYSQLIIGSEQPAKVSVARELCQIIVEDNGIGFDEKYLDRIFNVFQRLHSRSEYEGTGIGLAICRKIAERHHGSLTAKSTPGQGAKFIVTIPIKQRKGENAA